MKSYLYLAFVLLFILGCMEESETITGPPTETASEEAVEDTYMGAKVVADHDKLPFCNSEHKGHLFFEKKNSIFQYCDGTDYEEIELKGNRGEKGEHGEKGEKGEKGERSESTRDTMVILDSRVDTLVISSVDTVVESQLDTIVESRIDTVVISQIDTLVIIQSAPGFQFYKFEVFASALGGDFESILTETHLVQGGSAWLNATVVASDTNYQGNTQDISFLFDGDSTTGASTGNYIKWDYSAPWGWVIDVGSIEVFESLYLSSWQVYFYHEPSTLKVSGSSTADGPWVTLGDESFVDVYQANTVPLSYP